MGKAAGATDDGRVEPRETFAANLRRHRLEQELTQEALGDLSDLHPTEISLLERSGRDPRLQTIVRLARALRIDAAKLLDGVK